MKNWSEFEREDLRNIPNAQAHGFNIEFDYSDIRHNWVTPENPPMSTVRFTKGQTYIWRIRDGWQVADLINGKYCNHRPIKELDFNAIQILSDEINK